MEIYCYSNKIKPGYYIGQAVSMVERYEKDKYLGCHRIYNALQKYGLVGFDRWVLKIVDTQDEADQEEKFWIAEMRRIHGRENVYNIADGGHTSQPHTQETKDKISQKAINRKAWQGTANPQSKLSQEDDHNIAKLYIDGTKTIEISKIFNISASTVQRSLKRSGIRVIRQRYGRITLSDEGRKKKSELMMGNKRAVKSS